jgi:hypothetical protein
VAAAREARASGIIQKVEHPLKPNFEYTLRRVDRCHPRRPMDYTRRENPSMINWNEDPYERTTELHDHRLWSDFQADCTSLSSRTGRISSPHSCILTEPICRRNMILCSIMSLPRLRGLESLTCLVCIKNGTRS